VYVKGAASTAVTWTVTGSTSVFTNVSSTGFLAVSADENATTLTVTAASVFDNKKSGNAEVTVNSGSITGTDELFAPDLKIYPNPFADVVYITGMVVGAGLAPAQYPAQHHAQQTGQQTGRGQAVPLRVTNAAGIIVHTQKITGTDETIHLEHLPAGLYFFHFEKDGKTKTVKAIKK
jgi:hypothetical protein